MNSHDQPKRTRSDKENIDTTTALPESSRKRRSFFSEEKEKEMILFPKLRTLGTRLQNLRYEWLLGARLTSIDLFLTQRTADGKLMGRSITKPALKYLSVIIQRLSEIVSENAEDIHTYLTESLNSNTTQNNQHVIFLANILMAFKANIDRIGLLTDQAAIFENGTNRNTLKQNYNWIVYFHCVIKTAFDKLGGDAEDQRRLTQLTSRIQILQGLTYDSLKKNFPEISDQYKELEYKRIVVVGSTQSLFAPQEQKKLQSQQNTDNQQTATPSPTSKCTC